VPVPEPSQGSRTVGSVLLAAASLVLLVVVGGLLGPLLAAGALIWLTVHVLRRVGAEPPPFPRPRPTLAWLGEAIAYLGPFVRWAAPHVPFLAPAAVFVAITWLLPDDKASLAFQEQSSQIIPVLLIGFVIEAGALRWRDQPIDGLLSLVTVAILIAGETYALLAIADARSAHADIVAGAMAAGVVAILTAALQGAIAERSQPEPPDGPVR
jgi:hypothetical protein